VAIGLILLGSIAVKLIFIGYLDGRAYYDVAKAVNFGYLVHQQTFSIYTDIVNSKTFLGPIFWFYLYQAAGLAGLKIFNLLVFGALFFTVYALGKGRYPDATVVLALFLFAFYAGTNRNIAAGEPDDNIAALLFGLGVLVHLNTARPFPSALLMGSAFLFKYWAVIFCAAFGLYLLSTGRWREVLPAGVGMLLPFLFINLFDGFQSLRSLWISLSVQKDITPWREVGLKMLSTGMIFAVLASAWAWLKCRSDVNTLFFLPTATYFIYVLAVRDAFAASFVMMQCLMFASLLIAELLRTQTLLRSGLLRRRAMIVSCCSYIAITSAITYQHLYRDTVPISLVESPQEIEKMFWHRKL
jgi:hypothetical protein